MSAERFLLRIVVVTTFSVLSACGGDDGPIDTMDADVPDAAAGDGDVEAGEEDSGAADATVDALVRPDGGMGCGNEDVEDGEVCDDGNTVDGDGCSADCTSNERCGNGTLDETVGEICDDGNTVNGDGCSADCLSDETCGNGIVDIGVGEVCDDGNTEGGDGCSADCSMGPVCGNGAVEGTEVCDDGNTDGGDGCSADCASDETCGNDVLDPGEECDDGNTDTGDGCGATCVIERCGNTIVDPGEDCDDGDATEGDGCDNDCTFSCTAASDCDDGAPCNGVEVCDGGSHTCGSGTPPADGTDCGGGMVCRGGVCTTPVCGNGIVEASEVCDDGDDDEGDGCDNDCTFSCTAAADCDDGEMCTGDETCNTSTHTCTNPADLSDGTSCGSALVCRSGSCQPVVCGDGRAEGGEQCDDGDDTEGDGCDNDCTFSCTAAADCDDSEACNGAESCDTSTHTCTDPADLPDDTSCGSGRVCRSGVCTTTTCGNSIREGTEECDDGDTTNGDGCDNDCTFSCTTAADCTDGRTCNGAESCNTSTHVCQAGTPPGDGTTCDRDGMSGTRDICLSNVCVASTCGDGYVDSGAGEQCEDANSTDGDGCDNDCTFSCTAAADCTDGRVCNGAESCNTSTHTCQPGTPASDGTLCDRDGMSGTRDICLSGSCAASACGDGYVDSGAGEQCEDGNSTNGDGCDNDCTFTCTSAADCTDGVLCNGSETCSTTTHTCQAGTPEADGTLCDADGMPSTRDLCVSGTCGASRCGDGYTDPPIGEYCDDGNLTSGDGCEPSCLTTGSRVFRVDQMDLADPHFFIRSFGCRDVTDSPFFGFSLNGALQDSLDDYTINYINLFHPLDVAAASTPMDLIDGQCAAGTPYEVCRLDSTGSVYPTTAHNSGVGSTCFTADPSTITASYGTPPNVVSGPCYVTDYEDILIDVSGVLIPLTDARVAATYNGGPPPNELVTGVISGFLSEAQAKMVILPSTLPLVGGDTLYEHLAAGGASGSSCSSGDDRDVHDGVTGFWFYLNFHARRATWSP